MREGDLKENDRLAKLRFCYKQIEKHIIENKDFQGHIQINFFSGHANNWQVMQHFKIEKRHI